MTDEQEMSRTSSRSESIQGIGEREEFYRELAAHGMAPLWKTLQVLIVDAGQSDTMGLRARRVTLPDAGDETDCRQGSRAAGVDSVGKASNYPFFSTREFNWSCPVKSPRCIDTRSPRCCLLSKDTVPI